MVSKRYITVNVNSVVKVKLTDEGKQVILKHDLDQERFYMSRGITMHKKPSQFGVVAEDSDGWSTWQLWTLMKMFGDKWEISRPVPFLTDIRIEIAED